MVEMILLALSILVLNVAIYFRTIYFEYVIDDYTVYLETRKNKIPKPGKWYKLFWEQLRGRSYWNSKLAHVITLGVHAFTSVMVYLAFGHNMYSYVAAILFSLNAVNNQCSIWLSGRGYAISTLAILVGFALPITGPFAQIYAATWSFNGFFSALMYLGTDWWPYVAIPIVLFFWKHRKQLQFNQTKDPAKDTKIDGYKKNAIAMSKSWVKIVWMIKFYGYYLVTCLLNNKISFYHGYMHDFVTNSEGVRKSFILDRYFAIGLFGVGLTFWSIPEALRTPYGAAWGLVWFLVNVVIWTNLITFQQHISLRYVYLANVGLMLWLAHMLSFATWLLPAVIAWYICRNWFNQNAYKNDWWNTEYNIIQEPNYFYPWLLRGNTHFTRGMWMTAFYDYVEAKNFDPRNFKVHYNIISCMIAMNKLEEARQLTEVLHEIEVFGQEEIKAGLIKERLALISQIEIAKIRKEKLNLTVEDIGFLV